MKLKTIVTSLLMLNLFNLANANELNVGADAPNIKATLQSGEVVDLGVVFSEGITLVFFYPKADTPGCTAQACSLRDSFEELTAKGVKVFGVSYDSVESQTRFIKKYDLPYDLIADEDKTVSKAFGRGMFSRQAYLIQDGKVIWRDTKASTQSQAADVKQALTDLGLATFDSLS